MVTVIIPSAKCAPDNLPNLGRIPMALYPINGHTILHHIVSYYKTSSILIAGYEEFTRLSSHLAKEQYKDIRLFQLPDLKDLGYTILQSLNELGIDSDEPVIINFADTLIDNDNLTENCIVYKTPETASKKWTYLSEENGQILSYVDQEEDSFDLNIYKLVVGVFSFAHPLYLKKCLLNNKTEKGYSFFAAIKEYSDKYPFNFIEANHWLDLGHPDEYFNSQISVKAREFNHMSFDKNRGILRKTSDDKTKFKGEIEWYLKLPKKLKYISPRVFDSCTDINDLFIEMEFYSYPTLHEHFLYGSYGKEEWRKIFDKISFVLNDFSNYLVKSDKIVPSLYEMYYTKTIQRFAQLKKNDIFSSFFTGSIVVNGKKYNNLTKIEEKLDDIVKSNLLDVEEFCIIHGDMCFANMLIDDKLNFIKLIDPRGKFGDFDIYGDQRYEIAKLFHSVDGRYDYIIKDLFKVKRIDNTIEYSILDNYKFSLFELMKESFKPVIGSHLKQIEIIEALLFLSMIPLHGENINHQYTMLGTGLDILNRNINIEEN